MTAVPKRILVVDDDEDIRKVAKMVLANFGYEAECVQNGEEALALLNNEKFPIVLMDSGLPEINGIDFLKMLRARGDTTPVIIFTGVGREYAAIQALNNGADFFLKKGDDAQSQLLEMVHMIRQAVDRRNLGRGPGTTQKILSDALNFFHQAAYVIDREGKVMVWNKGMEKMTGVAESDILGKGDWNYSIPFFGHRAPMLSDLIFQDDATIMENNYTIIEKEKGTISAWIRAIPEEGRQIIFWMNHFA